MSPRRSRVRDIADQEARAGYQVRDLIEGVLGGRPFFLVVMNASGQGDVFSNMNGSAEVLPVLEELVRQMRAMPIVRGKPVEVTVIDEDAS